MKWLLTIFLLVIIFFSCEKNNSQGDPLPANCNLSTQPPGSNYPLQLLTETNYNQVHCGFMPLSRRNYWVYLDSIYDSNGNLTEVRMDTLRFTKTFQSPDSLIWWRPNLFGQGFLSYNYSTDSVLYTLGNNWGNGLVRKWFHPLTGDSSYNSCTYYDYDSYCSEYRLPNPVTVPAGTFENCVRFKREQLEGISMDLYFKPGKGVLKIWTYYSYPGHQYLWKKGTLLNYYIEN